MGIDVPPNALPQPIACVEPGTARHARFAQRAADQVRYVCCRPKSVCPKVECVAFSSARGRISRLVLVSFHTGAQWQARTSSTLGSSPAAAAAHGSTNYG